MEKLSDETEQLWKKEEVSCIDAEYQTEPVLFSHSSFAYRAVLGQSSDFYICPNYEVLTKRYSISIR